MSFSPFSLSLPAHGKTGQADRAIDHVNLQMDDFNG
jgi:hypothetical protein